MIELESPSDIAESLREKGGDELRVDQMRYRVVKIIAKDNLKYPQPTIPK